MSTTWTARGMAVLAIVFWASAYPWSKSVLTWLHPLAAAEARYTLAAVILLGLALLRGDVLGAFRENWMVYLLIGAISFTAYPALLFTAMSISSAMNVAVIISMAPLLTMIGGQLFFGEKIGLWSAIGMVIAAVGAALAVLGDNPRGLAGFSLDIGEPLALVAALAFSFYTLASRKLLKPGVPPLTSTAIAFVVGAIFFLPFLTQFKAPTEAPSTSVLVSLACLVVFSTVIGYLFWVRANAVLGLAEPNLLFNFVPVLAMFLTWWLQDTPPYPEQFVGAFTVLAGVTLASLGPHLHRHHLGHPA